MDKIVRATAADAQIRAFACVTIDTVEEARKRHGLSPVATAALGRLLSAGAMMGAMLKGEDDILTLQINGNGPIGKVTVTADSKGTVKGYVDNPLVNLPANSIGKLDVGGAVGEGYLQVIKDMGLKEPYAGQVMLQTGEIAEDLTYYFATSEQIPSSVGLGVLMKKEDGSVKQAGGFILQLMPFASDEVLAKLEENLKKLSSVTQMLESGMTPKEMLETILEGFDVEINDEVPTSFACNCSRERVEKALLSIGKKELEGMIADDEPVHINCHFCNTDYEFSIDELKKLIK